MNWKKLKSIIVVTAAIVLGTFSIGAASDNVQWNVYKTLQLDATPIDLVISPDGSRIFVLTDQGEIRVYASTTNVEATLKVGKQVDQIKLGPAEDTLILKSSKDKTIELITLDFVQNINVSGSPFKGPEDAPVVIAVFDDFQ
jgi:WD40 repeat protein